MIPKRTSVLSLAPPSHQRRPRALRAVQSILPDPLAGSEFKSLLRSESSPNLPAHAAVLNAPANSAIGI
jgi:hypothetical protein